MFVLAGCIFDFDYYSNEVELKMNQLKIRYFGKTDIIFRSYDIRKQKGEFACLVDRKKREKIYAKNAGSSKRISTHKTNYRSKH